MKKEDMKDDAQDKDKKAPPFGKSDDKDKDDEKDSKDKEMDKSLISEDDLNKSLDALEQLTKSGKPARKQELLQKSLQGTATSAESEELSALLLAKSDDGLTSQIEKSLDKDSNETFAKSLDVSDYLGELHKSLSSSLGALASALEKGESKREEQSVVLAKALLDIGKLEQQNGRLIKSLSQKVAELSVSPARAPKSAGLVGASPDVLTKSEDQSDKPTLRKSDIADTLDEMIMKGYTSPSGQDMLLASTHFEQTGRISEQLLREVASFRKKQS